MILQRLSPLVLSQTRAVTQWSAQQRNGFSHTNLKNFVTASFNCLLRTGFTRSFNTTKCVSSSSQQPVSYHDAKITSQDKTENDISEQQETVDHRLETQSTLYQSIISQSTKLTAVAPSVVNVYDMEHTSIEENENKAVGPLEEDFSLIKPKLPVHVSSLAAYVNESDVLQKLLQIKVVLSVVEKDPEVANFLVRANFEENIQPYLIFFHDLGIDESKLGQILTKNPKIFLESLDNLEVRINYLKSKKFSSEAIAEILTRAPKVISKPTKDLDAKLGYMQKSYNLTGDEVRTVVTRLPKLIIWPQQSLKNNHFYMKEFIRFTQSELKELFISCPKLFLTARKTLSLRFEYLHDEMGLTKKDILTYPMCLRYRLSVIIKPRHMFLSHLGRAQYDPGKEHYISLQALLTGKDVAFCENVAKVPVKQFNDFLKTM